MRLVYDASGHHFDVTAGVAARGHPVAVVGYGHSVWMATDVDWGASATPVTAALHELSDAFERFDRIARLKRAAVDLDLVEHAADGLIKAREHRGKARYFERVIETGMVVTYARAFAGSNRAGLGSDDAPADKSDRELHDEIIRLRNRYHAHADHTPDWTLHDLRRLFGEAGRPMFSEQWSQLPASKLRALADLAMRQRERFAAEANRLDIERFGPRDGDEQDDFDFTGRG